MLLPFVEAVLLLNIHAMQLVKKSSRAAYFQEINLLGRGVNASVSSFVPG